MISSVHDLIIGNCFLTNLFYSLSSVMDCHEVLKKKMKSPCMHMFQTLSARNTLTD